MASPRIYLDFNATAPVRPEAWAAFGAAARAGGNASSIHAEGRGARGFIEAARRQVATLVGSKAEQVVFTSGGTEAANFAVSPMRSSASGQAYDRLIVGATEHVAVLHGHRFPRREAAVVPVSADGLVDLDRLDALARRAGPAVVAVQAANNETGVLQPIREVAAIVHSHDGVLVCDAVQAAGRIPCDAEALGADVLLLSGHKLGGLPGAGAAIVFRDDLAVEPLLRGGGQERGHRGGTENAPALAAFGAAADEADPAIEGPRLAQLRDCLEAGLRGIAPDAVLLCAERSRLPNTTTFSIPGVKAERLMIALDLAGVAVSSGSACSSGKVGQSHVLEAMGVEHDLRQGAIRVSLGWCSSKADIEGFLDALNSGLATMKRRWTLSA